MDNCSSMVSCGGSASASNNLYSWGMPAAMAAPPKFTDCPDGSTMTDNGYCMCSNGDYLLDDGSECPETPSTSCF